MYLTNLQLILFSDMYGTTKELMLQGEEGAYTETIDICNDGATEYA